MENFVINVWHYLVVKVDTVNTLCNVFVKKDGEESFVINVSINFSQLGKGENCWFNISNSAAVCADNCTHGHCTVPGQCVCHPGWSGSACDQCTENPDCVHGRCVDTSFQCQCYDGYQGTCCEEPICSEGCHPEHVSLGYANSTIIFNLVFLTDLPNFGSKSRAAYSHSTIQPRSSTRNKYLWCENPNKTHKDMFVDFSREFVCIQRNAGARQDGRA